MSEKPRVTRREEDLLVLLKHARSCDSVMSGGAVTCPTCRRIDRQLQDGARYAIDDREVREALLRRALVASSKLSTALLDALECAPVQPATRSSALQLSEWLTQILYLFDSPLTGGVGRGVAAMSGTARPQRVRVRVVVTA